MDLQKMMDAMWDRIKEMNEKGGRPSPNPPTQEERKEIEAEIVVLWKITAEDFMRIWATTISAVLKTHGFEGVVTVKELNAKWDWETTQPTLKSI